MLKLLPGLLVIFLCLKAMAGDVFDGENTGSIVLHEKDSKVVYEDITGDKDGLYRKLIHINGSPALWVSSRYDFYYTLTPIEKRLFIDCAYFDVRNTYNGARATAGMCDLGIPLKGDYDEIAQKYSNDWRNSIYSFDTNLVIETGKVEKFFLGKIGSIEIYDKYSSSTDLENGAPQKYIKGPFGCFDFGYTVVFLVFASRDDLKPKYLDTLQSTEPMILKRLTESDLKKIATNRCS